MHPLEKIVQKNKLGKQNGILFCLLTTHLLLKLHSLLDNDSFLLIEATSNQVDQFGGYTGMTPADFFNYVVEKAEKSIFPLNS
ncbi:class II D-tagatose-bisphosphate aldolase, non-catalytic subunit [Providencia huaxiensis]|uniref:class II D-tagatose-bisphosphate aldolase non-catalytic subunit n=1 Tax=Providencia huaxiensis TaxID=2027290 RepID=UPI0034DD2B88